MKTYHLFIFSIVLLVSGCEEKQRPVEQLPNLTEFNLQSAGPVGLMKEKSFSIGSYPAINNMGDVTVDEAGNVYVVNNTRKRIEVFDENGEFIQSIGRAGGDPGEFQSPGNMYAKGNTLYAFDENLLRGYAFSTNNYNVQLSLDLNKVLEFLPDSLKETRPYSFQPLDGNHFLVGFQQVNAPDDRHLYFYRVNADGQPEAYQVMDFKSKSLYVDDTMTNTVIMMLPYERETLFVTDSKNQIYTAHTNNFLIRISDSTGNYRKAWMYPFENRKLVKSDAIDMFTNVNQRRAIRGARLPNTWPALSKMIIDDKDQLWVATISDNLENYRWFIIDKTGKPVGMIDLPRKQEIMAVEGGFAYVKSYNKSLYSDEVTKHKVFY